ncbi:Single-stranded-DNA-specific exonuclease RecJ [Paenibacillus konkukensis]|uniref:Single-stranded-DNA-specific exonuclease RecJ n=1 Tax=Paenibacillus konkukensis TaxID=2020716 RepID=A0ABY4RWU1_9BACL|nr:single-stranded-DNA-specific exonuclease RecJ [Paenibacillus konkukensis]UQZ86787.1 Single-stranded-DNA-specific exonuclease RecJ [Paenibacillus konkukensis]
MLQSRARWKISETDSKQAEELAGQLEISPLLAHLLISRGMTDQEHAAAFLFGGTDHIHDPFLLDGMEQAVVRIRQALERGEKIRIYGDYDADGVSSTTLMVHLLRTLDASFDYYIPHRVHEGYGMNKPAVDLAKQEGISLIITVDTGISAVEEIAYASELGIDVIVTDHHEPPEVLPEAYSVINPKKPGCPYPFKQLAGVGVALKLAQALLGRWPEELLEFAAIGTVADLMPLLGENRAIVKQGIKRMQSSANWGIRALLDVSGVQMKDVNATHIGFSLAPRINASGRLNNADDAVRLLITDSEQEAEHLAYDLDSLNKERQRIVDDMTRQAMSMMEERKASGGLNKVIVLAHEDWNVGVIGIVASKLMDRFYRPTLILGIDKETGLAKGSARSIAGFDLYQALSHCHDLMEHFGGHQAAAGMTLSKDHLPELERRLNVLAEEWLKPGDFVPLLHADMECALDEVGVETIRQLEQLGPFGMGNPQPKFVFTNIRCQELRTIGKEQQHVKMTLIKGGGEAAATLDAVGFNKSAALPWISPSASMDILGELSINEWNGVRKPQIMIQDIRVPHVQLFDWRGASSKLEFKLRELNSRVSPLAEAEEGSGQPAVITFHPEDKQVRMKFMNTYPVWGMDPATGQGSPLNEHARRKPLSAVKDLVLYDLPAQLGALEQVIVSASGAERWYAVFSGSPANQGPLPNRDIFKTVYGAVLKLGDQAFPASYITEALSRRSGQSQQLIQFILDVFEELGFIQRRPEGYRAVSNPAKKDLTASRLYRQRQHSLDVEQTLVYSSAQELHEWISGKHKQMKPSLEEII